MVRDETTMSGMLWGGRFAAPPHPRLVALTASLDVDMRLLPYDAAATKAHASTLNRAGLLDDADLARVAETCDELVAEWRAGELVPHPVDEDVHSVVERELTLRLGDAGARVHAGRSRNDLVTADFRLWCREQASELTASCARLVEGLLARARDHAETVMPGYTHLQRAQPVTLGYHLVAHAAALERDCRRFEQARRAADVSPLGAGALAGSTLALDVHHTAELLGFSGVFTNAMDAISERDFACDLAYASALCGMHLSRLATEVVLFTSAEFAFARLPDEWSTGSSMMPQKRNPDLAELVRGKSSGLIGQLVSLLGLLKGLPLAYNRDLQEDKAYLFSAVDSLAACVEAIDHLVRVIEFDGARLEAAAEAGTLWATDVAEELVAGGVPFRQAHARAGDLVMRLERDEPLRSEDPKPRSARASVEARRSHGGPSPERVREQIDVLTAAVRSVVGRS